MNLNRYRYLSLRDLAIFFLWLSLLVPMFFFYGNTRIRDFFVIKMVFLLMAELLALGRLKLTASSLLTGVGLVALLIFFMFANSFAQEKLITLLIVLQPLLYYQITRQLDISTKAAMTMLGLACAISVMISLAKLGITRNWRVGAVYIGGHFSAALLVLTMLFNGARGWKLLAAFDILKGMAGRYLFFLIIASTRRLALVVGFLMISGSYIYTIYASAGDFTFSAGYRITEYLLVRDALADCGYAFGCILGDPFSTYKLGTKGVVAVNGHFHNFWLICTYNFGLVGLGMMLFTFISIIRRMGPWWYVGVAYAFMMLLDSPRDGHWIFGFLTGVISAEFARRSQRQRDNAADIPAPDEPVATLNRI